MLSEKNILEISTTVAFSFFSIVGFWIYTLLAKLIHCPPPLQSSKIKMTSHISVFVTPIKH